MCTNMSFSQVAKQNINIMKILFLKTNTRHNHNVDFQTSQAPYSRHCFCICLVFQYSCWWLHPFISPPRIWSHSLPLFLSVSQFFAMKCLALFPLAYLELPPYMPASPFPRAPIICSTVFHSATLKPPSISPAISSLAAWPPHPLALAWGRATLFSVAPLPGNCAWRSLLIGGCKFLSQNPKITACFLEENWQT